MNAPAPAHVQHDRITVGGWLAFFFGTVWCWLFAWTGRNSALVSAEVFGEAFVYVVFWLLIACAIRGRKKNRNYNAVAEWYFWLSLFGSGLLFSARHVR